MKNVLVGLGWDARSTDGQDFDLDASAFLLAANGKVRGDADFIFYNNLKSADGSVTHTGDNRTGEGDGDDESLKIKLDAVPGDVDKIIFVVTIHDAQARRQSFGQVSGAFIRLVNDDNQTEVARYDLTEDASTETAMLFGELYRHNGMEIPCGRPGLCWWSGFRVCSVRHQRVLIKSNFLTSFGVMPPISTRYQRLAGAKNGSFSR
jgi:tellurium resistance protein TerD